MKAIILICLTIVLVVALIVGCVVNAIDRKYSSKDTETISREFNNYIKNTHASGAKNMSDFINELTTYAATIGESNKK